MHGLLNGLITLIVLRSILDAIKLKSYRYQSSDKGQVLSRHTNYLDEQQLTPSEGFSFEQSRV